MKSIETLGNTYEETYDGLYESLRGLERTLLASLMVLFPYRAQLIEITDTLRHQLGVDAIEVNILFNRKQITIVSQPGGSTVDVLIPDKESLCVLTVAVGIPLASDNIKESKFLEGHPAQSQWSAWASAPITVRELNLGTVCALEDSPRHWGDTDEEHLKRATKAISDLLEGWLVERNEEEVETD